MFVHISPENRRPYRRQLASMHRLRHKVFIEQLKWPLGHIQVENGMEFDQFDLPEAHYIVNLNQSSEVDACCRLLPTEGPYLLGDIFPELIESGTPPRARNIWEVSRFAADSATAPKNIVGRLVAAMLEVGLEHHLDHYVSVSDVRIEPLLRRAGWHPRRLGGTKFTGTDIAAGEIYEVSLGALENVRTKSSIPSRLIGHTHSQPLLAIGDMFYEHPSRLPYER